MKVIDNASTSAVEESMKQLLQASENLADNLGNGKSDELAEALVTIIQHVLTQDLQHDNANIIKLLPLVLQLQNAKESTYGRSWCRHGDISAFHNVERKWDRIANIMTDIMAEGTEHSKFLSDETGGGGEPIIDTILDMGIYSIMWVGLMSELRPKMYDSFAAKITEFVNLTQRTLSDNK